ncbi:hypothetical protein Patl1_10379 [Pistacia atlantica]|uniref:Uncharacterized protein n=1 Tax=Pistacia atlantica TaxID=434234 RepID=A0ACC1A2B2_9ROSI|nr:hypothetical protein Patl1_10379 [Pistacia atlantica]
MGRQWSAGKLVLILDAVHWNPEAPPRTLPRVRLRCGKARIQCSLITDFRDQCTLQTALQAVTQSRTQRAHVTWYKRHII